MRVDRKRLVKLVRDRVADFITFDKVAFEPVDHDQHVKLLRAKLVEEAIEYLQNPTLGELADVAEAVRSLAIVDLGFHPEMALPVVEAEAADKREERGGFEGGVSLFVYGGPPTLRHEGEHE